MRCRPGSAALAVLLVATAIGVAAQTPPPPAVKTGTTPHVQSLSLRGCLAAASTGDGFVLRNARNAADAAPPVTSAGAGTSATGEAPSGSITGQTPTGSTATDAPTPAVGTPGATANPASPTYNRDPAAATTGTVTESGPPNGARDYAIVASSGLGLREHVGHLVEVTGRLADARSARSGTAVTADVRAPARKAPVPPAAGGVPSMPTVDVHALLDVSPECPAQ